MACTNCGSTTHSTITCASSVPSCSSCPYTLNAECVKYKGDRLDGIEPETVSDGSTRSLDDLLVLISNSLCCNRESRIVEEDYTVVAEDAIKIILLKGYDEGTPGTITYTITLPQTADFFNKELIFKDISAPIDSGVTTIVWNFNSALQTTWNPVVTSLLYADHQDVFNVVKLRFIKTTTTGYQWVRV